MEAVSLRIFDMIQLHKLFPWFHEDLPASENLHGGRRRKKFPNNPTADWWGQRLLKSLPAEHLLCRMHQHPHSYWSSVCRMYNLTEQDSGKDNKTGSITLSGLFYAHACGKEDAALLAARTRRGSSLCELNSDANLRAEFRHFQKSIQKLKNCNN